MATHRSRLKPAHGALGISLIETMVTALLVTICVAGLLQFTGSVLQWYDRNQLESKETLEFWNRSRSLRNTRPDSPDIFLAVPGARPLHRFTIKKRYGRQWEVLCAEK